MVSPLLASVRERRIIKSIEIRHFVAYYWISYGVRSTKNSQAKVLFELLDNPHGGIQNTMQMMLKLNVMEESVEGHDTWNDSHVETSSKKLSFQTFYGAMI